MKTMKVMKSYILMAAVALGALAFSSCSKSDKPVVNKQVKLVAKLTPSNGIGTRTVMTDNGDGTISTAWEVNDKIWVKYFNTADAEVEAQATVTAVDGSGNATISVTLTDPKDASTITFGFPYTYWNEDIDLKTNQTGTLNNIKNKYAASSGTGTLTVSGGDATLPLGVTMTPSVCIWKFSFKDGSTDITSAVTKVSVLLGTSTGSETYVITPSSQSNIYVALSGSATPKYISVIATTASATYMKEKSGIALVAGKMYTSAALEMEKVNAFSVSASKKVIFAPGNLQATTTDLGANWTWNFAAHQYDYIGTTGSNAKINGKGTVSANGTVDLFYRSLVGDGSGNGYGIINTEESSSPYYGSAFLDWTSLPIGTYPAGYWRTLTESEWKYVLGEDYPMRKPSATVNGVANARVTKAVVNSVKGFIVFPDNYEGPTGDVGTDIVWGAGINSSGTSGWNTTCTLAGWTTLENAGCVFLPAAGRRTGTTLYEVGSGGFYKHATYWRLLRFDNSGFDTNQSSGYAGSIRLVHEL